MQEIKIEDMKCNPFTLIGKEWCLIAAKANGKSNAMTASWGGFGVLWNKNVATIYVRPQRYTRELLDSSETFTLSFFDETYKPALSVYGSVSGKEVDKEKETGLTLVEEQDFVYYKEAKLVMKCKKLYRGTIEKAGFIDTSIDANNYPEEDYHIVYIGEIIKTWEKKNESNY